MELRLVRQFNALIVNVLMTKLRFHCFIISEGGILNVHSYEHIINIIAQISNRKYYEQ